MKRGFDLLVSIATLPITLLLTIIGAVLVLVDDPGPPFHLSTRVGRHGRAFRLLKLRTMHLDTASEMRLTIDDDPRLTRIGKFLRRFRIDELPQVVNILRGEMSLVGPRPEDPRFVQEYGQADHIVLRAVPGIAGLAQLEFHDEATLLDPLDPEGTYRRDILPRKLAIDRVYVAHASMLLDLAILWNTALLILGWKDPRRFVERVVRTGRSSG